MTKQERRKKKNKILQSSTHVFSCFCRIDFDHVNVSITKITKFLLKSVKLIDHRQSFQRISNINLL